MVTPTLIISLTVLLLFLVKRVYSRCRRERCDFYSVFNGISLGLVISDTKHQILCVNDEAKRQWNLNQGELLSEEFLPNSILGQLLLRNQQGEKKASTNYRLSEGRPSLIRAELLQGEIEPRILLTMRDVSLEEKSRYYNEIYLKQSGLVFLGSIFESLAHEIRTPCLAAEACLQMIQEDILPKIEGGQSLSAQEMDDFKKHIRNGARTTSQISSLLNHSRNFRRGYRKSDIGEIELLEAFTYAKDTIQAAYNTIIGKRITIQTYGDGPYFIKGFLNRFLEAIGNLLKNSVEAIMERAKGEPDIVPAIQIYIRSEAINDHPDIKQIMTLEIHDNGCGLSGDAKKHVGTSLFTTKAHDPTFKGTGLGLTLAIRTINEIGGTWEIDNLEVKGHIVGSRTIVKIPLPQKIMEQP